MTDRIIMASSLEQRGATENPLESLATVIATDSADWGADRARAWIYGVVLGWDDDPDDDDPINAMPMIALQHGWSADRVARLRRLHTRFQELAGGAT